MAVNLWYHVGSKNEQPGKTGFAHLFEHLMFQGSEHYDDEYFKPFEQVGATSMNGTTSFDRTNYFQNVPTTALDLALWMESDRMGHLLGVVTQPRLDEQRGVVKNEKRQGENRPYGRVSETVYRASFPPGHPYRTLPIGSMADLDAATLDPTPIFVAWVELAISANTLTALDGTAYEISAQLGITGIVYSDGVQLAVSDSGITSPGTEAIDFTLDEQGHLTRVVAPGGGTHVYDHDAQGNLCLLYTSPSPRDRTRSSMPSSA